MTNVDKPSLPPQRPANQQYEAKGGQNTGGYRSWNDDDDLFRKDDDGGDFTSKGPQNTGGYGIQSTKDKTVARSDADAPPADPLFTDKVDIDFRKK